MAMIVIQDATATKIGVHKYVFEDLNDLSEKSLATAVLRVDNVDVTEQHEFDVLSDFEETGGVQFNDDKTVAVWHDAIQTSAHYTFLII